MAAWSPFTENPGEKRSTCRPHLRSEDSREGRGLQLHQEAFTKQSQGNWQASAQELPGRWLK